MTDPSKVQLMDLHTACSQNITAIRGGWDVKNHGRKMLKFHKHTENILAKFITNKVQNKS